MATSRELLLVLTLKTMSKKVRKYTLHTEELVYMSDLVCAYFDNLFNFEVA